MKYVAQWQSLLSQHQQFTALQMIPWCHLCIIQHYFCTDMYTQINSQVPSTPNNQLRQERLLEKETKKTLNHSDVSGPGSASKAQFKEHNVTWVGVNYCNHFREEQSWYVVNYSRKWPKYEWSKIMSMPTLMSPPPPLDHHCVISYLNILAQEAWCFEISQVLLPAGSSINVPDVQTFSLPTSNYRSISLRLISLVLSTTHPL